MAANLLIDDGHVRVGAVPHSLNQDCVIGEVVHAERAKTGAEKGDGGASHRVGRAELVDVNRGRAVAEGHVDDIPRFAAVHKDGDGVVGANANRDAELKLCSVNLHLRLTGLHPADKRRDGCKVVQRHKVASLDHNLVAARPKRRVDEVHLGLLKLEKAHAVPALPADAHHNIHDALAGESVVVVRSARKRSHRLGEHALNLRVLHRHLGLGANRTADTHLVNLRRVGILGVVGGVRDAKVVTRDGEEPAGDWQRRGVRHDGDRIGEQARDGGRDRVNHDHHRDVASRPLGHRRHELLLRHGKGDARSNLAPDGDVQARNHLWRPKVLPGDGDLSEGGTASRADSRHVGRRVRKLALPASLVADGDRLQVRHHEVDVISASGARNVVALNLAFVDELRGDLRVLAQDPADGDGFDGGV
mmetsp:Transcript_23679/g.77000  ORF Transcript_23679/g.77000 Transcript_23679/m.77000 type:complete len:418 (+) Transcript_23679:3393-4646(+)